MLAGGVRTSRTVCYLHGVHDLKTTYPHLYHMEHDLSVTSSTAPRHDRLNTARLAEARSTLGVVAKCWIIRGNMLT